MLFTLFGYICLMIGVIMMIYGFSTLGTIGILIGIPTIILGIAFLILDKTREEVAKIEVLKRRIDNIHQRLYEIGYQSGMKVGLCPNCNGHEPPGTCGFCSMEICADCKSDHYMNYCPKSPHYVPT